MRTRFDFTVRGYELDSFGHVNNAVYVNYLEEARWKMIRDIPECRTHIIEAGLFPAVIETRIKYVRELTAFSEAYVITEWKTEGGYLIANHRIYDKSDEGIVTKAIVKMLLLSEERVIHDLDETIKGVIDRK